MELYELCSPSEMSEQPLFLEFAQRLLVTHPADVANAYAPLLEYFVAMVEEASEAGLLRPGRPRRQAAIVLQSATTTAGRSAGGRQPITARRDVGVLPARHRARLRRRHARRSRRPRRAEPENKTLRKVESSLSFRVDLRYHSAAMDARPTTEQRELEDAAVRLAEKLGPTTVGDLDDARPPEPPRRRARRRPAGGNSAPAHRRSRSRPASKPRSSPEPWRAARATSRSSDRCSRTICCGGPAVDTTMGRRARSPSPPISAGSPAAPASPSMPRAAPSRSPLGRSTATPWSRRRSRHRTNAPASISPGRCARLDAAPTAADGLGTLSPDDLARVGGPRRDAHRGRPRRGDGGRARAGHRLRQGAPPVRRADRFVPGRAAPARRGQDADRGRAERDVVRRVGGRRARRRPRPGRPPPSPRRTPPASARTVCETAIQVHGGIGNTWECMAHVFLRRALLSTELFGGDGPQLALLAQQRWGARTWTFVIRPTRPSSASASAPGSPNRATRVTRSHSDDGYWTSLGDWHQHAVRGRVLRADVAGEVRRPRAAAGVRGDRRRGAGPRRRAAEAEPRLPDPGHQPPRQRGDQGPLPARPDQRPRPVVPGLQRARRRVRPRRRCARRRRSTATSTSSTGTRSGRATPTSPSGASCWPAPIPTSPSTRGCRRSPCRCASRASSSGR